MSNDVVVLAEHFKGALNDVTLELLSKGRELAAALGGRAIVALLGYRVEALVATLGAADAVWLADGPEFEQFIPEAYVAVLEGRLKEVQPRLVLLGSTSVGLDVLGLLSARTGFPCFDSCTRLEVRDGALIAISQLYGGKVFTEVALPQESSLVAVTPGAFPAAAGQAGARPEVQELPRPAALAAVRTRFRQLMEPPPGDLDITKFPALVAVGRGIKGRENLGVAEALAEMLGGAVCASRPVIDQAWLPKTRQVGKSGMTVKPKLYLALGVSGAPEHVEGMKGAELIVAINTDPQAPIFSVAHYGAVADLLEVVPALVEEIRTRQGHAA